MISRKDQDELDEIFGDGADPELAREVSERAADVDIDDLNDQVIAAVEANDAKTEAARAEKKEKKTEAKAKAKEKPTKAAAAAEVEALAVEAAALANTAAADKMEPPPRQLEDWESEDADDPSEPLDEASIDPQVFAILKEPKLHIVYSVTKFGKSTDVYRTFNRGIYGVTNKNGFIALASFILAHRTRVHRRKREGCANCKLRIPLHYEIPQFRLVNGERIQIDPRPYITMWWTKYRELRAKTKGTEKYPTCFGLDEMSKLFRWVDAALGKNAAGGYDLKHGQEMTFWARYFAQYHKEEKTDVVLMHHEGLPVYTDATKTRLKYMGGPDMPSGPMRAVMPEDADIVVRGLIREVEYDDGTRATQRVYTTQPRPEWICGVRGFGIPAESTSGLRALYDAGGIRVP